MAYTWMWGEVMVRRLLDMICTAGLGAALRVGGGVVWELMVVA